MHSARTHDGFYCTLARPLGRSARCLREAAARNSGGPAAADEWLATFADPMRAQGAIDRFTSNSYDLLVEGDSYRARLKPTLKRASK